jgi:voltage-dependent calcium channel L type alpha-1D
VRAKSDWHGFLHGYRFLFAVTLPLTLTLALAPTLTTNPNNPRDPWNWLDFTVVFGGLLPYVFGGGVNVSAFRVFRALRPLKSLNSVQGMKALVTSLLKSIPALFNVFLLLLFVFTIFGILGVQFFAGSLHGRCRMTEYPIQLRGDVEFPFSELFLEQVEQQRRAGTLEYCMNATKDNTTGKWTPSLCETDAECTFDSSPWIHRHECAWPIDPRSEERICSLNELGTFPAEMCTSQICGSNYDFFGLERFILPSGDHQALMTSDLYVAKFMWGHAQFDSMWQAILTIFQCITMEGWTEVMYMLMDASGWWFPALYFFGLSLFGSLFLLNLTLAVIAESFRSVTAQRVAEETIVRHHESFRSVRKIHRTQKTRR